MEGEQINKQLIPFACFHFILRKKKKMIVTSIREDHQGLDIDVPACPGSEGYLSRVIIWLFALPGSELSQQRNISELLGTAESRIDFGRHWLLSPYLNREVYLLIEPSAPLIVDVVGITDCHGPHAYKPLILTNFGHQIFIINSFHHVLELFKPLRVFLVMAMRCSSRTHDVWLTGPPHHEDLVVVRGPKQEDGSVAECRLVGSLV
jgi:hypothetical protein